MWPSPESTDRLLNGVRDGGAADELLGEFREPLRRLVSQRLDPALTRRVDASDIVQDVLLEANQRLQEYLKKPGMPFHLWVRHLAKDRIIDAHRRHRQAQRRSLDREQPLAGADESNASFVAEFVDTEATPSTEAVRRELQRKLSAAIAELDDGDREIVLMRHQELLSNQDAARALDITDAAASMRYLRAIRRLKASLSSEPEA